MPKGSPPTGKKSAGKAKDPKTKANPFAARQDARMAKAPTAGKGKAGAKRKGMR